LLHLPGNVVVTNEYGWTYFRLDEKIQPASSYEVQLQVPGNTYIKQCGVMFECTFLSCFPKSLGKNQAVFDFDELPGILKVRNRKPGDMMRLHGSGKKKVKELFIDSKIPKQKRDSYPLLCAGDVVIWIPFLRRSDVALVHEKTKNILLVEARDVMSKEDY
jgi:tRNA(Ile)-lysidine synthase